MHSVLFVFFLPPPFLFVMVHCIKSNIINLNYWFWCSKIWKTQQRGDTFTKHHNEMQIWSITSVELLHLKKVMVRMAALSHIFQNPSLLKFRYIRIINVTLFLLLLTAAHCYPFDLSSQMLMFSINVIGPQGSLHNLLHFFFRML